MTVNLTAWAPEIMPEIMDLPVAALLAAVRDASIRFCEETQIWLNTLAAIDVVATTREYTLTIPSDLNAILEIVPQDGVSYKQSGQDDDQYVCLTCLVEKQETAKQGGHGWKYETHPYPSSFWVDNVDKKVNLSPIPSKDSDEGLLVSVILKPTIDCTTVPDFIYNDYRKCIGFGALSYLFKMKGVPWYDLVESGKNEGLFLDGCGNAKNQVLTGGTDKELNMAIPYFAG